MAPPRLGATPTGDVGHRVAYFVEQRMRRRKTTAGKLTADPVHGCWMLAEPGVSGAGVGHGPDHLGARGPDPRRVSLPYDLRPSTDRAPSWPSLQHGPSPLRSDTDRRARRTVGPGSCSYGPPTRRAPPEWERRRPPRSRPRDARCRERPVRGRSVERSTHRRWRPPLSRWWVRVSPHSRRDGRGAWWRTRRAHRLPR